MARQNLSLGTSANDGTGDTLRDAGQKINQNFTELYTSVYGDSIAGNSTLVFGNNSITFEGSVADNFETILTLVNPTAARTVTMPDATGVIILDTTSQTLTNKTLTNPVLVGPGVRDASATYNYIFTPSTLGGNVNTTLPLLSSNDEFTFNNHTQTLLNKTLMSPLLIQPRMGGLINDSTGNPLFGTSTVPSAVNYVRLNNSALGGNATIDAAGSGTNINLHLSGKGTGSVAIRSRMNLQSETITADGPASTIVPTTLLNAVSTLLISLPDGTTNGDVKKFINVNAGDAIITPISFNSGTSFTLKQNAAVEAMWASSSWYLIGIDAANDITHNIFIS